MLRLHRADGPALMFGDGFGIFDDPAEAAGWTYGLTGGQYARLARRPLDHRRP